MGRVLNQKKFISIGLVLLASLLIFSVTVRGLLSLSQYPERKAARLHDQLAQAKDLKVEQRLPMETALLQYETDNRIKIWTAIVQAAGGAALLVGLLFTASNLRATQDKLDIDRQGQLTSRFIQATSQLGAELSGSRPNVEVRLGGIYALNRIANDWPKDYWPIAELLTAYVRHNAPWSPTESMNGKGTPRTEIQAILTVLGRDEPPEAFNERHKLDLRNTDLRCAEFWNARLDWIDFWGAHLEGAKLWGACLRHAKLENAHLAGANLRGANLEHASLEGADLTGAIFDRGTMWPDGFDARARGAVFPEEHADGI
jgi:hypothetical protein